MATESIESGSSFIDKISGLTKVHRIIICVITFAVFITAFVFLSYFPQTEEIRKLEEELSKLDKQVAEAKKMASKLEYYRAKKKEAEVQFLLVLKALPENQEIPSLLTNIARAGKSSGLKFLLFQPKKEIVKDFYAEIPVQIKVEGNYHSVAMFFDRVSRLYRIVNIRNININASGGGRRVNTDCQAVTYKFVEKKNKKKKKK